MPTRPEEIAALNDALRALRVALGPETWRGVARSVLGASWDLWPGREMTEDFGGDRMVLSGTPLTRRRLRIDIVGLCSEERAEWHLRGPGRPVVPLAEAVEQAAAWAVERGAALRRAVTGGGAVTPRRPALGAVLDALTEPSNGDPPPSFWCTVPPVVIDRGAVVVVGSPYHSVRYPWATTNPAEAWEILQARDLIPLDYRGRFVCERCNGSGLVIVDRESGERDFCDVCAEEDANATGGLRAVGHRPHPPTIAALAAWASLGFAASDDGAPGILGAEELMGELDPDALTRWRVTSVADVDPRYFRSEAARRLSDAGFGWSGGGQRRTLYVPPLGVEI